MIRQIKSNLKKFLHYEGSSLQKYRSQQAERQFRKEKSKLMRKIGMEELLLFFEIANKCRVKVWLEFGTLLGAYREHSFIAHDFDLDVGMLFTDYTLYFEHELLAVGFIKTRAIYKKNMMDGAESLTEVSFMYKGFSIDVFLSRIENEHRRVSLLSAPPVAEDVNLNLYSVRDFLLPKFNELVDVDINGHVFSSPGDPVETLKTIYGETFMIPDPNWITTRSEYNIVKYDYSKMRGLLKGSW